jgi:hypothetical protein
MEAIPIIDIVVSACVLNVTGSILIQSLLFSLIDRANMLNLSTDESRQG